jgi:hypothetical protein
MFSFMNSSCKIPLHFTERNMRTRENRGDRYVTRDEHGLVLEENQSEQNQTVFKIYNNRTELFVFKTELTIKVVRFYGFKQNHNNYTHV